jgi:hypothetical protein
VFTAQYWNTPGAGTAPTVPATTPTLTRDETAIDHDWALGAPAPAVDADHFVARWTRSLTLTAGWYDFTATTDDGVRLWIDGQKVVDRWVDQGATGSTAHLALGGGAHTIAMEYYENAGGALARLTWAKTSDLPPAPAYRAEFWNTPGAGSRPSIPARAPDLTRSDGAVDFDWGGGPPDPSVDVDHFVARWTRTDVLPSGLYRFSGTSDDGVRVFVDDQLVVDKWRDQNEPFTADKLLLGGPHTIRVEYYEGVAGALVRFGYTRVGDVTSPPGWDAQYFANPNLSGTAAVTRQDADVDFDWGTGVPATGVPADGFSARWTRTDHLAAGV